MMFQHTGNLCPFHRAQAEASAGERPSSVIMDPRLPRSASELSRGGLPEVWNDSALNPLPMLVVLVPLAHRLREAPCSDLRSTELREAFYFALKPPWAPGACQSLLTPGA